MRIIERIVRLVDPYFTIAVMSLMVAIFGVLLYAMVTGNVSTRSRDRAEAFVDYLIDEEVSIACEARNDGKNMECYFDRWR